MTVETRADLVQLAQHNLTELHYLSNPSEQILSGVDMACVSEGSIFPVHSYVIMSASPVFSDVVASHFSEAIKGSSHRALLRMPLDAKEQTTREALQYMYARCAFNAATPHHITDFHAAQQVAVFAHKYNIQPMLGDADSFVWNSILTKYEIDCGIRGGENVVKAAKEIIELAANADRLSTTKTSIYCETWLITRFKFYQEALPKLLQLRHEIIARVMQRVADRLR